MSAQNPKVEWLRKRIAENERLIQKLETSVLESHTGDIQHYRHDELRLRQENIGYRRQIAALEMGGSECGQSNECDKPQ